MLTLRPAADRGQADHGWLQAAHTFSFADYLDPAWMGFGSLRVLNQDRILGGQGFATHPHRNMEIVTVVLEGALRHADSLGEGSILRPGDVQLMSAGSGIRHSEFNASADQPLHLLQMWVEPERSGTEPRYEERHFGADAWAGKLLPVVSPGTENDTLTIGQDARLFLGQLAPGDRVEHGLDRTRRAWLHVATGSIRVGSELLGPGDGAGIQAEEELALEGIETAQVVLWDLA